MITRFALLATIAALFTSGTFAADAPDQTGKLIAVLQADAALFDKARACQQLGEIGNQEAVSALATMLSDPRLSAYARSGLEGIPDPSAAAALREATGKLKGSLLAGVVNSLGAIRNEKAVELLTKLASDPASGVSSEAFLALGNIASPESIQFVLRALAHGPDGTRDQVAAAALLAADRQRTAGHLDQAIALYDAIRNANVPTSYHSGATRGAILARKTGRVPFLIEQLRSGKPALRNAALLTVREIPDETLAAALNAELTNATPELQGQLLLALVDCHNAQSVGAVAAVVHSPEPEVRKTALTVLGRFGPSAAPALLATLQGELTAEDKAVVVKGLRALESSLVDDQILVALRSAASAGTRIELIRLLTSRRAAKAGGELLKQAAGPDQEVRFAALNALEYLGGAAELPGLIALSKSSEDPATREAAEKAARVVTSEENAVLKDGTPQGSPVPLFDGRSLAGWDGNTNVWRVRDQVIVGGSMNGNARNEFLATVKTYTNFHLRLDYKLVGTEGFVNGGVQFRSVRITNPPNEMKGYQADIGAGYSGCLYDESRRNKILVQPGADLIRRIEKPGDWNRYEVRCEGARIQIWLNGEQTVDYTEADPAIPPYGLIALQIHGECKAEIGFRDITIRKL